MLSAQWAILCWLRVTNQVMLVARLAAITTEPTIRINVFFRGAPIHSKASEKLLRLTDSRAAMDGGWKNGTSATQIMVITGTMMLATSQKATQPYAAQRNFPSGCGAEARTLPPTTAYFFACLRNRA